MKSAITDSRLPLLEKATACGLFLISLLTYLLTGEPTASFWDCPEYVASAAMLEPGHPPGNPTWMLTAHIATLLAPSPACYALAVNITSAIFSALTILLMYLTLLEFRGMMTGYAPRRCADIAGAAIVSLIFAWSDTFWFSATEAEVYAMSSFFTAMTLWLPLVWLRRRREGRNHDGLLILTAYLLGLSIGVHLLNLLVIPAIALILLYGSRPGRIPFLRLCIAIIASFVVIVSILYGMVPGLPSMVAASDFFWLRYHLPLGTGVFWVLLLIGGAAAVCLEKSRRQINRTLLTLMVPVLLYLCGFLSIGEDWRLGLMMIPALMMVLSLLKRFPYRTVNMMTWSILALVVGYSTFILIPIRGYANPPMNQGDPHDAFSFRPYLNRNQYGSHPLLKGPTPNSRPLKEEFLTTDTATGKTVATYGNVWRTPAKFGQEFEYDRRKREIVKTTRRWRHQTAPELDMLLPRIFSSDPSDMDSYADWAGVTDSTMTEVEASVAIDDHLKPVGRLDNATGERVKEKALRPTYAQNACYFATYQLYYMYLRYLLWNFSGRQNDIHSTGEADHGNFITGIPPIDSAMIGDQSLAPAPLREGRTVYFMLPLLLGIAGMVLLQRSGRGGRRVSTVILTLFLMTGLAIVVYLNQTPGEPRERDYSFAGSFYAFALWAGMAAMIIIGRARSKGKTMAAVATALLMLIPLLMAVQLWPVRDRSRRTFTRDMAAATLEAVPQEAIIFVNGDNRTFPLWYAQEAEGVRRDVRVVNQSYLSTFWYLRQLMTPTSLAPAVPLTIPDTLLLAPELTLVTVGNDTTPVDAVKALRRLYAGIIPDKRGRIPSRYLRIPAPQGDSVTIDLRTVAGGTSLPFGKLMQLDIIATNASSPRHREIFWSMPVLPSMMSGLSDHTLLQGTLYRLDTSVTRQHTDIDATFRWLAGFNYGSLSRGIRLDDPGARMAHAMRSEALICADSLLLRGDTLRAVRMLAVADSAISPCSLPYGILTRNVRSYNDAELLARLYQRTGLDSLRPRALRAARAGMENAAAYCRYYKALTPRLRSVLSGETLLARKDAYAPFDAWLSIGGARRVADSIAAAAGMDLKAEQRLWHRSRTTRLMASMARKVNAMPHTDPIFDSLCRRLRDLGGGRRQLEAYREFDNFNFERYGF